MATPYRQELMDTQAFNIDVTEESFSRDVIEQSQQRPVVVDFWAPWCGPCQTLMPMLTKLAEEYAGLFILAKVNIDEQQQLALHYGVRSVPTVKLFRNGQIADEFMGALPESAICEFIERHIERESDRQLSQARELLQQGEIQQASDIVGEVIATEPNNSKAHLLQAEILTRLGDFHAALQQIEALPADSQLEADTAALKARLEFGVVAQEAPDVDTLQQRLSSNPADSKARYQLATHKIAGSDYAGAMEELLELMKRDRNYKDDAARKGLLKLFEMLGSENELVGQYRRKMFNLLH